MTHPLPATTAPAPRRHGLRPVYDPASAAAEAGVSRSFLYAEMAAGRLHSRKAGRRRLILGADLGAWLESLPTS